MPSADLVKDLAALEDRPWAALGKTNKPITQNRVADIVRQFTIFSGTIRVGDKTPKGYQRDQFRDAWSRYFEPEKRPI
jgi:hypothetical protein